jgi:phosphotransacetylase
VTEIGDLFAAALVVAGISAPVAAQQWTADDLYADRPFGNIEVGRAGRGAAGGNDPAALRDTAVSAIRGLLTGNQQQADEARTRAAEALAKAQNIPVDQARTQVQQYEQQYRQTVERAKQQATEAADVAAKAVSRAALLAALSLLLGAVAGWIGGRMGAVEPTATMRSW